MKEVAGEAPHHDSNDDQAVGSLLVSAGLMIEVVKYAPKHLTAVEWKALMVLADDANDKTRVVFTDIENEKFLEEMDVEANRWRSIRASLKRKGVLIQDSQGCKGHRAKFRIAQLKPSGAPLSGGDSEARGSHAPFEGEGARNSTQRSADPARQSEPKARGIRAQRRVDSTRPTPPTPQEPSNSSKPAPPATPTQTSPPMWAVESTTGEGEGTFDREPAFEAQPSQEHLQQATILVDKLPYDRQPTAQERADLTYHAARWFAAGWIHNALMAKCERNLDTAHDRIRTWLSARRLGADPCPPPPSRTTASSNTSHQTFRDPDPNGYGSPKKHRGFQNPTDPDAYRGEF